MIQIELQPEIEDRLAAQAAARGVTVTDYVRDVLVFQAGQSTDRAFRPNISEAIARIRELRKGNRLNGVNVQELIHEGHKY